MDTAPEPMNGQSSSRRPAGLGLTACTADKRSSHTGSTDWNHRHRAFVLWRCKLRPQRAYRRRSAEEGGQA
jgi:hypothetical protein